MKKIILTLLTMLMLTVPCLAMQNPMVKQPSIMTAEKTAGFMALSIFPGSDFHLDDVFLIDGKIIDLRYSNQFDQKFSIRSARYDSNQPDISGVYTDYWEDYNVGDVSMRVVHLYSGEIHAACWNDGNKSYAIYAENMKTEPFMILAVMTYHSINPEV